MNFSLNVKVVTIRSLVSECVTKFLKYSEEEKERRGRVARQGRDREGLSQLSGETPSPASNFTFSCHALCVIGTPQHSGKEESGLAAQGHLVHAIQNSPGSWRPSFGVQACVALPAYLLNRV